VWGLGFWVLGFGFVGFRDMGLRGCGWSMWIVEMEVGDA